jgi:hypothetical protein
MTAEENSDAGKPEAPGVLWRGYFSLADREERIRLAAYYRYLERGRGPGHELDDWLAAEAEIEHGRAVAMPAAPAGAEWQQGSRHAAHEDEALKRLIRQHPRQAIPRVEDVEPGPDIS